MDKILKILLSIITLLCCYTITSVGLGWICKIGVSENYQNINQVSLNLSYSYIAGLIFYFFISYLPFLLTKQKLKTVINLKIDDLSSQIESYIQTFRSKELKEGIESINLESIKNVLSEKTLLDESCFSRIMALKMSNHDFITQTKSAVFDLIETILQYKQYMTLEQIVNLEKIRDSKFFHLLKVGTKNSLGFNYYNSIAFNDAFAEEFFIIIESVKKLKAHKK